MQTNTSNLIIFHRLKILNKDANIISFVEAQEVAKEKNTTPPQKKTQAKRAKCDKVLIEFTIY